MAWTALTYAFGSLLTSTKMTQLFDNLTALANGDSGAPAIQQAALDADIIGQVELKNQAVGKAELFTAQSSVSTGASSALLTLPGGEYSFYPQTKISSISGIQNAHIVNNIAIGVSYISYITLGTTAGTISAQSRYIQASPPYMIGSKKWGHFLFLLRRATDGVVVSSYEAEDPCWAYNGNPMNAKDSPERISEVPHPFADYWQKDPSTDGLEVVLIDLRATGAKKWVGDNRKIGKGLLEDVGTILPSMGIVRPAADYGLPVVSGFTDKVKIITP